ncbi:MAG: hypothetical protein WCY32_08915 [Burkholderiaceae bacterium]
MQTIKLDPARLYGFRILGTQPVDTPDARLGDKTGGPKTAPPKSDSRLGSKNGGLKVIEPAGTDWKVDPTD